MAVIAGQGQELQRRIDGAGEKPSDDAAFAVDPSVGAVDGLKSGFGGRQGIFPDWRGVVAIEVPCQRI